MKRRQILNEALSDLFLRAELDLIMGIIDTLIEDQEIPPARLIQFAHDKLKIPEKLAREIISYYV